MNNSTCNHVTGLCDAGCDFGWTGSICDKGNLNYFFVQPLCETSQCVNEVINQWLDRLFIIQTKSLKIAIFLLGI